MAPKALIQNTPPYSRPECSDASCLRFSAYFLRRNFVRNFFEARFKIITSFVFFKLYSCAQSRPYTQPPVWRCGLLGSSSLVLLARLQPTPASFCQRNSGCLCLKWCQSPLYVKRRLPIMPRPASWLRSESTFPVCYR